MGRASGVADGEGTQVPKGCQQRGDLGGLRALNQMEVGGPPKRGRHAIPQAKGLVERRARHCQATGNALHARQHPLGPRTRGRQLEEATHEDVLQAEEAGKRSLEGWSAQATAARDLSVRGWGSSMRLTYTGEPLAKGRRRVAPRHGAARPPLPGPRAGAGNWLRPATPPPVRGRRR